MYIYIYTYEYIHTRICMDSALAARIYGPAHICANHVIFNGSALEMNLSCHTYEWGLMPHLKHI